MGKKRTKAIHQPFEGRNPTGQFAKITMDMMQSPAWKALSLRQQGLYLYMKSKYREKKHDGVLLESNKDDISLPEAEWRKLYGHYNTFRGDMDALEGHGFVRVVFHNKYSLKPNLYGFSDAWVTLNGATMETVRPKPKKPVKD